MKKGLKMLEVDEETHAKLKLIALKKGMTIKVYMKILAEQESKKEKE